MGQSNALSIDIASKIADLFISMVKLIQSFRLHKEFTAFGDSLDRSDLISDVLFYL